MIFRPYSVSSFLSVITLSVGIVSCSIGGNQERTSEAAAPTVTEELRPLPVDSVSMFPWQSEARNVTRDFCLRLFQQVNSSSRGENVVVSPIGAQMILSMAANAASGNTFSEVKRTFGFNFLSINAIDAYHAQILDSLSQHDPWVLVSVGNGLWLDHSVKVNEVFRRRMATYRTIPSHIGMETVGELRSEVNEWARHATNGVNTELLTDVYKGKSDQMMLASTLYFYGLWADKFITPNIYRFANQNGWLRETVFYEGPADNVVYNNEDFTMVRKSFGQRRDFSMFLLLPHEGKDIDDCIRRLSVEGWIKLIRSRKTCEHMNIALPRFSFDVEVDLTSQFKAMGMLDAFDEKKATFSNMTAKPLNLKLVPQRIRMSVNQMGIESEDGGYVQDVPAEQTDSDISFNRPFVFVVTEISSGAFFYMGKVVNL